MQNDFTTVGDLFQDIFDGFGYSTSGTALRTSADEKDDSYIVQIEVPGATQDMIDVQYKDNIITVDINYGTDNKLRTGKYKWAKEFKGVDASAIVAKLEGGVLNLTLPKKPDEQAQKIKIN